MGSVTTPESDPRVKRLLDQLENPSLTASEIARIKEKLEVLRSAGS